MMQAARRSKDDVRALEARLRALRDPQPPAGLVSRLEAGIPASFGRSAERPRRGPVAALAAAGGLAVAAAGLIVWIAIGLLAVGTDSTVPGATLADVLRPVFEATDGVQAVHLVARMRVRAGETLSFVDVEGDLVPVEAWFVVSPDGDGRELLRGRVEKGDRTWCWDGTESRVYFRRFNEAKRGVWFDYRLLWPGRWMKEMLEAPPQEVEVLEHEETATEGRLLVAREGTGRDPFEPVFWDEFDRETEVTWDRETGRLKSLRRWVRVSGRRVLYLETVLVEYPPAIEDDRFRLDLPVDVRWRELAPETAPEVNAALSPRDVVVRIFEAAEAHDREALERFIDSPALVDWFMTHRIELISVGEPIRIASYPGHLVPYEVRVWVGGLFPHVKRHRLAVRNDNPEGRWQFDGGW